MVKEKKTDVSVIIPFYNGNQYMERLLGCLQKNAENMAPHGMEAVIVNDSPDCEIRIDKKWCPNVDIHIIHNEKNVGIHESRVRGMKEALGEYILMLDQDDLIADYGIKSQLSHIGNSDVVVSNGEDENPNCRGMIYHSKFHQKSVKRRKNYFAIGCQIVSPGQCLMKKEAIPDIWLRYPISKNGADDYFLWLLMLTGDIHFGINYEVLYRHVNTGNNVSLNLEQMISSTMEVIEALKNLQRISKKEEKQCLRRLFMRRQYEGQGLKRKILAYVRYPDIGIRLLLSRFGL